MSTIEVVDKRESDGNAAIPAKSRTWFSWSFFSELCKLARSLPTAGSRLIKDISTGISLSRLQVSGGYIDDKTYIGERVLQLIAGLPEGSGLRKTLTGHLVRQLWSELEHPPKSYLGDEYRYRTADGHNNNVILPELGRAGSAYARSVTPMNKLPAALPDASTVFDALFARDGQAKEHPNKIASTLFYMATIVTHDLFLTNVQDPNKVDNSSYLDLSPLYGNSQAQQDGVRTFVDGKLKPDAFADARILGLPPGVCVMLLCFNRFHNHIASELAAINEGNRFEISLYSTPYEQPNHQNALRKRDNDLFQTARLITCGLYINILLFDYLGTILALNRSKSSWNLDPREVFSRVDIPTATGNQTSVEFNLIYRWHSAVSARDEGWANAYFKKVFHDDDINEMSSEYFMKGIRDWGKTIDRDPGQREFAGLSRGENGKFDDEALVKILQDSTEDIAGEFTIIMYSLLASPKHRALGARNVPKVLKAAEILGIKQARQWQVASLNEFRRVFHLKPHQTFLDINRDPDIARSLEILYGHPDLVELYPGLVAEETKEPMEGQGLCLGFTVGKTILSDAIALVRGDRFYTDDFNPACLTHWGFDQASARTKIAKGGSMYKLLMKAFPGVYRPNSVYALFPFTVPQENRRILQRLGEDELYDFEKPLSTEYKPHAQGSARIPNGLSTALSDVLDSTSERAQWTWNSFPTATSIFDGGTSRRSISESGLALRESSTLDCSVMINDALLSAKHLLIKAIGNPDEITRHAICDFYETEMSVLVRLKGSKLRDVFQLDIANDVLNISHARFMHRLFGIKTDDDGSEMRSEASTLAASLATELKVFEGAEFVSLREAAQEKARTLRNALRKSCQAIKIDEDMSQGRPADAQRQQGTLHGLGIQLIRAWFRKGKTLDEVIEAALEVVGAMVASQARASVCVLDFYLSDRYKHHWHKIAQLAQSNSTDVHAQLKKYALEAYFLGTPTTIDSINGKAYTTQRSFSEPQCTESRTLRTKLDDIDLERPSSSYEHLNWGMRSGYGLLVMSEILATELRVFGRLKNLRLAPGPQGLLKTKVVDESLTLYMNKSWSAWLPYPTTKMVHFDALKEVF